MSRKAAGAPQAPGIHATPATAPRISEPLHVPRLELWVQVEGGKGAERCILLEGDVVRIGSHPSNDVVLEDRQVSSFHCRLTRGARSWMVADTGSRSGTKVNGLAVRDADLALPECRIELGGSVVAAREAGYASAPPSEATIQFGALYGSSRAMRKMYDVLDRVARTSATLLIEGESGTGKELVTAEVVRRSQRAGKPFVVIDCASISHSVVESELFGHARGAFTGADRQRVGAFEAADGGTVFLDEIGELPLDMQPKLLRVLETGHVRRMGENQPRKVDVRVIAATNRQLEREVNHGRFREDLFFRLSVLTVRVPPLRDRKEDIPLLVEAFLVSLEATDQRHLFTPDVMDALARHDWPGNVRELKNFIERRVVFAEADLDRHGDDRMPGGCCLSPAPSLSDPRGGAAQGVSTDIERPFRLAKDELIASFERGYLTALLTWAEGNVSRAARKAKIDRIHLHRLLQQHGLRGGGGLQD